jgi:arylsulfatase A-like enzyme
MLGEHGLLAKKVFYEGAVNVPCLFRPPNGQGQGSTDALLNHLDIVATLIDICGAAPLQDSPSQSIAPLLHGKSAASHREAVLCELGLPPSAFVMVRTNEYKLSADAKTREPIELYDLAEDPAELHNLIEREDYAEIRQHLLNDVMNPMLSRLDTTAW